MLRAFTAALHDTHSDVRSQAAHSLGILSRTNTEIVKLLLTNLHDQDSEMRCLAAVGLGRLEQAPPEVVKALLQALDNSDPQVRYAAASSLGRFGQVNGEILSVLAQGLIQAQRWYVRLDSADLLNKIGQGEEQTIDALWNGLLDSNDDVRATCVKGLAIIGRRFSNKTTTVLEKIMQAIKNPEFDKPDVVVKRSAHDYAYDALWLLEVSGKIEEV